jgi:phenylpropionate dioxygenase-like ring-hydroxylating dioxygenase large terminal subunit
MTLELVGMTGSVYDYDPERIEALCGAYRGAGPLTRPFYTSPEIHNADMDRIWRRHWLYAGHSCLIPQPGDWMTWAIGFDSVILARGKDGELRAFHNTCRHRGARVCREEQGHGRAFVCPYHAWTYDLDGRLKTATEREFGVHPSKLGLHPVPLKNIAGLLFVALGDDPVSFDRVAAEVGEKMKHQWLEDAKLAKSVRYTVKANWKLVFENNRECYHCNTAHPEYVQGTYDTARFSPQTMPEVEKAERLASERFARMGLGDAMASSEMTGAYWRAARTPLVETFRARNEWSDGTLRSTIFPNFWQHASDDHAVATRLTPIDATTCQADVYWFVHKDAVEGKDYDPAKLMPFWQRTSEQDWEICEANQAGILSPRYEPGPYSAVRETNVQHFVDWYLGSLGGPRAHLKAVRG